MIEELSVIEEKEKMVVFVAIMMAMRIIVMTVDVKKMMTMARIMEAVESKTRN